MECRLFYSFSIEELSAPKRALAKKEFESIYVLAFQLYAETMLWTVVRLLAVHTEAKTTENTNLFVAPARIIMISRDASMKSSISASGCKIV